MSQQRKPVQTTGNTNDLYKANTSSPGGSRLPQGKIKKRELWWHEKPSEKKIPDSKPFQPTVPSAPRIDNNNLGFQPKVYNGKKVETQTLNWKKELVVDTWGNKNHKPGGGNRGIIDDKVSFDPLPRVDCGFNYEIE